MPFKIIQTIEDGEMCLCVVPVGWESDGVLRWPKKKVQCPNSRKMKIQSRTKNGNV